VSAVSRKEIIEELSTSHLIVSPLLSKKQIGPTSIDLRMGNVALLARAGATSHVDPAAYVNIGSLGTGTGHTVAVERMQKHQKITLPFKRFLLLHPGALALVPTLEWVVLPEHLQGVVTARSTWAREGLSIATATIVNPGYRGIVTLELANLGEIPMKLYPGLRIAQIAFYKVNGGEALAPSQFQSSFEPSAGNIGDGDHAFFG
jgi:dCTP deaminase